MTASVPRHDDVPGSRIGPYSSIDREAAVMGQVIALSPNPGVPGTTDDPGPALESLEGTKIGFRVEWIWPAYHHAVDEWQKRLAARGAETVVWEAEHTLAVGLQSRNEFASFVDSVDFAIVGLANCGSCTSWAVHHTVAAVNAGKGAICVVTAEFADFARHIAGRVGRPGMRTHVLPFPFVTLSESEIREIAVEHLGGLLRACGLPDRLADQ
jgi:hypothetical protein